LGGQSSCERRVRSGLQLIRRAVPERQQPVSSRVSSSMVDRLRRRRDSSPTRWLRCSGTVPAELPRGPRKQVRRAMRAYLATVREDRSPKRLVRGVSEQPLIVRRQRDDLAKIRPTTGPIGGTRWALAASARSRSPITVCTTLRKGMQRVNRIFAVDRSRATLGDKSS
jgi:hypothetical protein